MYDWLATLPREVHLFWTGKTRRSLPAILYFSNKYLNMLSAIASMFLYLPQSDKVRITFVIPSSTEWLAYLNIVTIKRYGSRDTVALCDLIGRRP